VSDRLLGSGGYANVYLAKDLVFPKQLACKIVKIDEDQEKRKAAIREAKILSRLSHV
jgi:serine/threonine protein kinase